MKRWRLIVGIAVVLIVGALAGSIGTGYYLKQHNRHRVADSRSRKAFILEKFSRELNLTADQKAKLEAVVDQIEEKRREYLLKSRAEAEVLMDQIRRDLTEDQQKKFDLMREKYKARRKAREEGPVSGR